MRKFVLLSVAVFLFSASSALAGPGKRKDLGTSNNGPGLSFDDCNSPTQTSNCANFTTSPFETVNGIDVYKFVINPGDPSNILVYDVFQIPGAVNAGDTFSMTFNTLLGDYGVFACNNSEDPSAGFGLDSLGNPLSGPCTAGTTAGLGAFVSETDSGNTASFKFLGGGPASWTFYTTDGNLAALNFAAGTGGGGGNTGVPEPASLSLLAVGGISALLGAKFRRR
ncbi:MAG TPA: PEP-CTERM sorting domain-containing protein [Dongiaceae bacterium]|nr:PEP-CTERM sorting domain-containing protein [Dongiaceae bacterium]